MWRIKFPIFISSAQMFTTLTNQWLIKQRASNNWMGVSPGLVVMGGDSCSKGREFESGHHIMDGHFSHLFVVKIVMFVWRNETKWKRGQGWPILKKTYGKVAQWWNKCICFHHRCFALFCFVLIVGHSFRYVKTMQWIKKILVIFEIYQSITLCYAKIKHSYCMFNYSNSVLFQYSYYTLKFVCDISKIVVKIVGGLLLGIFYSSLCSHTSHDSLKAQLIKLKLD